MHKEILENFFNVGFEYFYGDYFDSRIFISYLLENSKPENILDIGCGVGTLLACMPESFKVGIDLEWKFLKVAKKCNNKLEVIQANAEFLPIKDDVFSTISTMHLFPVIHNFKGNWKQAINEINRISKKESSLYITGANRTSKHFSKTHPLKHRQNYLNHSQQSDYLKKLYLVNLDGYGPHSRFVMYPLRIIYKIPNSITKKFKIEELLFRFLKSKRYLKNGRSYVMICKKIINEKKMEKIF